MVRGQVIVKKWSTKKHCMPGSFFVDDVEAANVNRGRVHS